MQIKKIIVFLFISIIAPGCANTPSLIIPTKNTIIVNEFIEKSGLAEKATTPFGLSPVAMFNIKNEKEKFVTEDINVVWFCVFKHMAFLVPPILHVKWFSPDGKLYKEDKARTYFLLIEGAKASLPIKGTDVANFVGDWKLEIYFEDQLVETRNFSVE